MLSYLIGAANRAALWSQSSSTLVIAYTRHHLLQRCTPSSCSGFRFIGLFVFLFLKHGDDTKLFYSLCAFLRNRFNWRLRLYKPECGGKKIGWITPTTSNKLSLLFSCSQAILTRMVVYGATNRSFSFLTFCIRRYDNAIYCKMCVFNCALLTQYKASLRGECMLFKKQKNKKKKLIPAF